MDASGRLRRARYREAWRKSTDQSGRIFSLCTEVWTHLFRERKDPQCPPDGGERRGPLLATWAVW